MFNRPSLLKSRLVDGYFSRIKSPLVYIPPVYIDQRALVFAGLTIAMTDFSRKLKAELRKAYPRKIGKRDG